MKTEKHDNTDELVYMLYCDCQGLGVRRIPHGRQIVEGSQIYNKSDKSRVSS